MWLGPSPWGYSLPKDSGDDTLSFVVLFFWVTCSAKENWSHACDPFLSIFSGNLLLPVAKLTSTKQSPPTLPLSLTTGRVCDFRFPHSSNDSPASSETDASIRFLDNFGVHRCHFRRSVGLSPLLSLKNKHHLSKIFVYDTKCPCIYKSSMWYCKCFVKCSWGEWNICREKHLLLFRVTDFSESPLGFQISIYGPWSAPTSLNNITVFKPKDWISTSHNWQISDLYRINSRSTYLIGSCWVRI